MPRAVAVPVRLVLWQRWRHGQSVAEIADALALAPRTVRHLIHAFRAGRRLPTLAPGYKRCGRRRSWPNQELVCQALDWRCQHPAWGAGLIRVLLAERWPHERLPTVRTLQRWFAQAGLGPAPRGRQPASQRQRATQPHETWQMDAVEQLRLKSGQRVSWLRIVDEFTGAILHTRVFPTGRWSQVGAAATQVELQKAFARWGRPLRMRVDNGPPWGSKGDLPTPLALWLLGLDIALAWNPPRQPKKNAVVERTQGVSQRWVEAETCAAVDELQQRLEHMDQIQRERYPNRAGQTRLQAHPQLTHARRLYTSDWETHHWRLRRVLECLADYAVPRRVDAKGEVSLYDCSHWVGRRWIGEVIYVTVDPHTREWVYQDREGRVLRRQAADELTRERITHLRIGRTSSSQPHGKTP